MFLVAFEKPGTWFIRVAVRRHVVPTDFSIYAKQTAALCWVSWAISNRSFSKFGIRKLPSYLPFSFPYQSSLHSIPPQAAFLSLPLSSPRLVSYLFWIRKPLPPLSPLSLGSFLLSGLMPTLDEISVLLSPEAHKRMCSFQLFRKLLLDKLDSLVGKTNIYSQHRDDLSFTSGSWFSTKGHWNCPKNKLSQLRRWNCIVFLSFVILVLWVHFFDWNSVSLFQSKWVPFSKIISPILLYY